MTLKLYYNKSEKNKVGKTLELVATYTGALRPGATIVDPVITVQVDQSATNIVQCNYLYIEEFKRYYFINEIKSDRNTLWELHCHVDVLDTYNDYFKVLNALVDRRTNGSDYIADGALDTFVNPYIQTIQFPNGFTAKEYLLTVIGKSPEVNP